MERQTSFQEVSSLSLERYNTRVAEMRDLIADMRVLVEEEASTENEDVSENPETPDEPTEGAHPGQNSPAFIPVDRCINPYNILPGLDNALGVLETAVSNFNVGWMQQDNEPSDDDDNESHDEAGTPSESIVSESSRSEDDDPTEEEYFTAQEEWDGSNESDDFSLSDLESIFDIEDDYIPWVTFGV